MMAAWIARFAGGIITPMRQLGLVLIIFAFACDGGASVDAGAPDASRRDAAMQRFDAGALDAGSDDAGAHDAGSDAGSSSACGEARPAIDGITGTEGLVIARDGTIYYSQSGAVGRMRPGGEQEDDFVPIPASTVWGLALDAANETLFVGAPGEGVIRVELASVPSSELLVPGGQPNGLAFGPDGFLYYSDFSGRAVRRVDPSGESAPTVVSAGGPIDGANGIAFEPAGTLLVASYATGTLYRLTLDAGVETERAIVSEDLGAPDGVAVGADGTIFVSDQASSSVYSISSAGVLTEIRTGLSQPASLEFGAGALRCEDLYVAIGGGALQRIEDVGPGVSVPWH